MGKESRERGMAKEGRERGIAKNFLLSNMS